MNSASGQISIINNPENHGLSTAWLLATLGSKRISRKIVKKDINYISITKTCQVISKPDSELSLRMTSSLLYGVSLLFKQQVDFLWNDVNMVNNRLVKDFNSHADFFKQKKKYNIGGYTYSGDSTAITFFGLRDGKSEDKANQQQFMEDDRNFLIEEFSLPFQNIHEMNEEELNEREQRIVELKKMELKNNQTFNDDFYSTFRNNETTISQNFDINEGDDDDIDDNVFGFGGDVSFKLGEYGKPADEEVHFEFDNDGKIVENNDRHNESGIENEIELSFDLNDGGAINQSFNENDVLQENQESGLDQHFSTTNNDNSDNNNNNFNKDNTLLRGQTVVVKTIQSRKHKLEIDDKLTLSSSDIRSFAKSYNFDMLQFKNNLNSTKQQSLGLRDIISEGGETSPHFLNLVYKHIFGYELSSGINDSNLPNKRRHGFYGIEKINSMIENHDHLEVGRNIPIKPNVFDDRFMNELDLIDLSNNVINDYNQEVEEGRGENDEYDVLFDFDDIEQRSKLTISQDGIEEEEDFEYLEESIDYTPGANKLLTQRVEKTRINNTIIRFFNFLIDRSNKFGNRLTSVEKTELQSKLNLSKELHHKNAVIQGEEEEQEERDTENEFRIIKLNNLIPSKNSQNFEEVVNRKIAAKTFSSILELTTRNIISIDINQSEDELRTGLLSSEHISIIHRG